jgi:hypothetical protein
MVGQIVLAALGIIAAIAPGLLADVTNKETDEEAIQHVHTRALAVHQRNVDADADLIDREKRG